MIGRTIEIEKLSEIKFKIIIEKELLKEEIKKLIDEQKFDEKDWN